MSIAVVVGNRIKEARKEKGLTQKYVAQIFHMTQQQYSRFENGKFEGLTVATTRPETMFGDVAVMVNPNDERYKAYIGKSVYIPGTDRKIPIISDEYV